MEFPLLLENTGQIRVSHSKLRVNFQCFEVKTDGFFSVALLSFNVGKIVERIWVIRSQGQGSIVAIFSLLYLQNWINPFKLNEFPTLHSWMSLFPYLGVLGGIFLSFL